MQALRIVARLGLAGSGQEAVASRVASALPQPVGRNTTFSFPVIVGMVRLFDLALLCLGGVVATASVTLVYGAYPQGPIVLACFIGSVAAATSLAREGSYRQDAMLSLGRQLRLMVKPLVLGTFCLIACLYTLYSGYVPMRTWPLAWLLSGGVLLSLARVAETSLFRRWTAAGHLARKVAIVGVGEFSEEFIARLREEPHAYRIIGLYDDRHTRVPPQQAGIPVLGSVQDLLDRSQREAIDVIVVALPLAAVDRIAMTLDKLGPAVADLCLTTDLAGLRYSGRQMVELGSNPVVSIREAPLKDWRAISKVVLDYSVGVLALVVLSPVLLATAALIRLESPGPILFRQPRMGFNNKLFLCYKFRSMHHGMTDLLADKQTTRGDPRITRVGRIIRKLSIDELPQLINVLNGTMSLVGPRPHAPNTKAADHLFAEVVQKYAQRHRVKPGITGWAQVNGWRGETSTVEQIEQRVACDLFYIENWSVRFDLKIMAMTILREVRSRNAF